MIISDKYKCIFIRVPKTGSTSIENLWKQIDPNCQISNDETPPYGHFKCSELKKMIGEEKWNNYFKFAFIREPKNWFKSQYTDNMKYCHEEDKRIHILLNRAFMLDDPEDKIIKLDHCINLYIFLNKWFLGPSMNSYLDLEIDFIGFLEDFHNDIKYIFNKIGLKENIEIPHHNKSTSNKYSFDEDSEKFINMILKKDIDLYDQIKKEKEIRLILNKLQKE